MKNLIFYAAGSHLEVVFCLRYRMNFESFEDVFLFYSKMLPKKYVGPKRV